MNTARLKRALSQELYWVFHGFIALVAVIVLLLETPLTLGPALACGAGLFVALFAGHLWKPTAVASLMLTGVVFVAECALFATAIALHSGFEKGPAVGLFATAGGLLGALLAWVIGRDQLHGPRGRAAEGRVG